MPVPGPPVNLLRALQEMGQTTGNLRQLLRAPGGITPNTGPNAGVPQSGTIALTQLIGAQGSASYSAVKSGDATGNQFRNEPAPSTLSVSSNNVTVSAVGGSGSYTFTWSFISGDAAISINGGTNGPTKSWTKTLNKNNSTSAVWRCTVSDGVNPNILINVNVSLSYFTDA